MQNEANIGIDVYVIMTIESENFMSNPLDTKVISKLAEILDKTNLTELEYEDEGCRICLTRNFGGAQVAAPVYAQPAAVAAPVSAVVETPAAATAPVVSAQAAEDYSNAKGAVKSPMVGVVYLSSEPSAPDYVKVGDSVTEGDTVCLIEAMKTFNPVKAHMSGKVVKILVASGDPVEYGEPLIVIE